MNENEYVTFVIEHKCNSKCAICFLKGADNASVDLHAVPFSYLKKFLRLISKDQYSGIVFSGAEVTLNEQLPEYAAYARDKGFRNIMIQTNARALSDICKAKQLRDAGINQFFVSFHSADKDLSDRITGSPGAYFQTVKALENLNKLDLMVITNTVMSSMNYTVLPQIGEFLLKFSNIVEMQFWAYIPMNSKVSELMLPYALTAPYLNKTIKYLINHRKEICVKYFPVCLLDGPYKKYHKNDLPYTFGADENFFRRLKSCNFQKYPCCGGTNCEGLPEIYKSIMPPGSWMP